MAKKSKNENQETLSVAAEAPEAPKARKTRTKQPLDVRLSKYAEVAKRIGKRTPAGEGANDFSACMREAGVLLAKAASLAPGLTFKSVPSAFRKEALAALTTGSRVIVGGQPGVVVDVSKKGRGDNLTIRLDAGLTMDFSRSIVRPE